MKNFNHYQSFMSTTIQDNADKIEYYTLGLCGESGEVAEKIKKGIRDGHLNDLEVAKELGDVLWYLTGLAQKLGYDLEDIVKLNVNKLLDRQKRNKLKGNGDNR